MENEIRSGAPPVASEAERLQWKKPVIEQLCLTNAESSDTTPSPFDGSAYDS